MHNKILVFLAALLCVSATHNSYAQNLGVHPTTLNFNLATGQSEAQVINVSNGSGKKVQFKLYLNDWVRDSLGGHTYMDANTHPRSCAKWITLDKNFLELEPGQASQVTVKMQVPDGEKDQEMKWSMLFIETVEEQNSANNKQAQATVRNLLRIGIHIYETPPSVTAKEVKVFDLKASDSQKNTYLLLCQNTGKTMLECKSYLELASLADGKKTKLDNIEFPIFPDQKRYVTFELPADMPKGKYSALAVVDAGEDLSLEAVESVIEVK